LEAGVAKADVFDIVDPTPLHRHVQPGIFAFGFSTAVSRDH
jgi:hypothetical protein